LTILTQCNFSKHG